MIPWIREKFAERRARWLTTRKQQQQSSSDKCNSFDEKLSIFSEETTAPKLDWQRSDENLEFNTEHDVIVMTYSPMGTKAQILLPFTATGLQLKLECFKRYEIELKAIWSDAYKSTKLLVANYKLIKARIHYELNEQLTLEESKITHNDELLLVMLAPPKLKIEKSLNGPTQDEIDVATKGMPIQKKYPSPPIVNIEELVLQSDVQYDIRQILISLIETSAYVIGAGPYAKRLIYMLKQRLISKKCHKTDTLQLLVDMGFSKSKATYSLHINPNYETALNWLIENENNTDLDTSDNSTANSSEDASPTQCLSKFKNLNSSKENIAALLVIIRIYCQKELPPSHDMVNLIKEMGFPEKDVIEALKLTKNNHSAACDWLIGNLSSKTISELTIGLPSTSPILKALLSSSHVQLSLSNPKIFIAYLSILEDYASMSMWLSDSETSGIIGHILRTYHEEKHILAINQFSSVL